MAEDVTTATTQTAGEAGSSAPVVAEGGVTAAPAVTPNSGTGERTFTQAELDAHIARRLKEADDRRKKQVEEEAAKAKGEWETVAKAKEAEIEALKAEVAKRDHEALMLRVAAKHKLPPELADRLRGEDEAALEADAKELAKLIPAPHEAAGTANPAGNRTNGTSLAPGQVPSWSEALASRIARKG